MCVCCPTGHTKTQLDNENEQQLLHHHSKFLTIATSPIFKLLPLRCYHPLTVGALHHPSSPGLSPCIGKVLQASEVYVVSVTPLDIK
jgi:hypothetical protein